MSRMIVALPGLSERLAAKTGVEQAVAEAFIIAYFDFITRGLTVNENVSIKGLGTFTRTNDADNAVVFKPCPEFELDVNRPFAIFQPVVIDASLDADDVITDDETIHDGDDITSTPTPPTVQEPVAAAAPLPDPETTALSAEPPLETDEAEVKPDASEPTGESIDIEHSENENTQPTEDSPVEIPEPQHDCDETEYVESLCAENFTGISQRRHVTVSMLMLVIGLIIGAVFGYFLNDYLQAMRIKSDQSSVTAEILAPDSLTLSADTLTITSDAINDTTKTDTSSATPETVTKEPVTIVTDTVTSQRFLTTMARKYYGHMEYWAFIYEANAERLGHPNRIKPGTVVNIPSLKSITAGDSSETQTMQRARRTGAAIYARYE